MSDYLLITATILALFITGCTAEASKTTAANAEAIKPGADAESVNVTKDSLIPISANSPADTVRAFYQKLRDKKYREAIFLTNLRPAVEGLTDTELKEFEVDFQKITEQIPSNLQINGEVVSGDNATVTLKLPDEDSGKQDVQQIELRKDSDVWVILTMDAVSEAKIKKEGKNFFYALRIETHEDEARSMLERISKAQLAHMVQNGGVFGDIKALAEAKLLPEDALTAESTGYNYAVDLAADKKSYTATATPAEYNKSGRLSFAFASDGRSIPKIVSKDNGGKPLK